MVTDEYDLMFNAVGQGMFKVIAKDNRRHRSVEFECSLVGRLLRNAQSQTSSASEDLLDLALAIYIADRIAVRKHQNACHIHIDIEVREPSLFTQVDEQISDILHWFTGDQWTLNFRQRGVRDNPESGMLVADDQPTHIALWSGGLDSLAGTVSFLKRNKDSKLILIGTSADNRVDGLQGRLFRMLIQEVKRSGVERRRLIVNSTHGTKCKMIGWGIGPNRLPRTRGFLFMLVASAVAMLESHSSIHIFENGFGAINLPFAGGGVRDHSRSVHPKSMLLVQSLLESVAQLQLPFINPFLVRTKGELCSELEGVTDRMIRETITCDRRPRKPNQPRHCGWCSSCLLRRVGLHAAQIEDRTNYGAYDIASAAVRPHILAMVIQARQLRRCLQSSESWRGLLGTYPELRDASIAISKLTRLPIRDTIKDLTRMYTKYVDEWEKIQPHLMKQLPHELVARANVDWTQ